MSAEIVWLLQSMRPAVPTALMLLGALIVGMSVMRLVDLGRINAARAIEDAALEGERLKAALYEPTGPMPILLPSWHLRIRLAGREIRDWGRDLFMAETPAPDWAEGEIAALPPSRLAPPARPPLRTRGQLPQSRLSWGLRPPKPPAVTPLVMPRRLEPTPDRQTRLHMLRSFA